MGRFRELWASGKFVLKARKDEDCFQQQEALRQFGELSPELSDSVGGACSSTSTAIVAKLKTRRSQETGRWLRDMSPKAPEPQPESLTITNTFEDTLVLMDALFGEFCDLAYEFNKTAFGSDLLISYVRPAISEKKSNDEWYRSSTKTYQGRLTTKQWTLIVRGLSSNISVFLLPSAMSLAFTAGQLAEVDYPPFLELLKLANSGSWTIGGEAMPLSTVSRLAKELLGDLIRVSSGAMAESELGSDRVALSVMGKNLPVGYDTPKPSAGFDQMHHETSDSEPISMPGACDIVDGIVDRDLKRLYAEAALWQPSSKNADIVRKQISAVEAFRSKMFEAFEQYALMTLPLSSASSEDETGAETLLLS